MKAALLVGGYGTRLRPLTFTTPKPMLPLINTPFLETKLLHLREHGIREVILSTGYLPTVFDEYFGDGSRLGMKLTHVTESKPLGTCGAIKNVEKLLGAEPVIVCNGDILTDLDVRALVDYHRAKGALVTISLAPVEDPTQYGLVPLDEDGRIKEFLEKPSWDQVETNLINAGTYVLDPIVLKKVPRNESYSFERELFPDLLEKGKPLYGFPSNCYWLDLGTPEKYLKAHEDILEGRIKVPIKGKEIEPRVFIGKKVRMEKGAKFLPPVVVGDEVTIGVDACLGPSVCVGNRVSIGASSRLEDSIIMNGATIEVECEINGGIIGNNSYVGKKTRIDCSVLGDNVRIGDDNELLGGIRIWPSAVIGSETIKFG